MLVLLVVVGFGVNVHTFLYAMCMFEYVTYICYHDII